MIAGDRRLDALERDIGEDCTQLPARRRPVASDLRLVITVIKMAADLERMGDGTRCVARMAETQGGDGEPRARYNEPRRLGEHVRQRVRDALDAFARTDVEAALGVTEEDRGVDHECESTSGGLLTFMMPDPRRIPRGGG